MTISVEVPNEVYAKASEIASSQGITVASIFSSACAEHIAAWERLQQRARRGDRNRFLDVLAKVPDVEPEAHDRL